MANLQIKLGEAKLVTKRLVAEAGAARQSWALFEGLRGRDNQHRKAMLIGATHLCLNGPLNGLSSALGRDTMLTLMRMTDPPGDDKLTLCRLSKLLECNDLKKDRIEVARNWIPASPAEFVDADAARCAAAMKAITDLVPPLWSVPPSNRSIYDLRIKLKPVRDAVLAHSIDTAGVIMPGNNDILIFLRVVSEVVEFAQLVFLDSAISWKRDFEIRLREATALWDLCQDGVERGSVLGSQNSLGSDAQEK